MNSNTNENFGPKGAKPPQPPVEPLHEPWRAGQPMQPILPPPIKKRRSTTKVIALLGIIVLLVAGAYFASQYGLILPSAFDKLSLALVNLAQVFVPGEKIALTADKT